MQEQLVPLERGLEHAGPRHREVRAARHSARHVTFAQRKHAPVAEQEALLRAFELHGAGRVAALATFGSGTKSHAWAAEPNPYACALPAKNVINGAECLFPQSASSNWPANAASFGVR